MTLASASDPATSESSQMTADTDETPTTGPTAALSKFLPSVTNMIRLDHTHVLSTFHQYKPDAPARVRRGLANTICTALEVHAQLEEEIFYPAVRAVAEDDRLRQSVEEHDEMRRLIAVVRSLEPDDEGFEENLMALMRDVMHHVADEETIVLPMAEHLLADELGALGARMTRRRLELAVPRTGEIAMDMARAVSGNTLALSAAAVAAVGLFWMRRSRGPSNG